ncbi:MAG TPA: PhnD/SsuA/transferrin family substrate-binding protein [Candidatus Rifleibacterium sp.]|nr:PhnD/SsuA/transferrin family substrate-binding protein [Candidatus Rifleibacterium sp.]
MGDRKAPDKTSIFVGVTFLLIAGIVLASGILWKSFVEYTGSSADLPEVFASIAAQAPYATTNDAASRREIIFTFTLPRGDLVQFIDLMQPNLDRIVEKTGKTAKIDVSMNEQELANKLSRGQADFGSLNIMNFLNLRRKYPIKAVLERFFDPPKKSLFIVKSTDAARNLEDMRGYRLAYQISDKLPGYLVPLKELKKRGIEHGEFFKQELFTENYSDSLLGLQNDQYDCIVLTSNFFGEQPEEVKKKCRVIHESHVLPGGVYVVNSQARNPYEQTVVGNFIKFGAQVDKSEPFVGMYTTRQPDESLFDMLDKEYLSDL